MALTIIETNKGLIFSCKFEETGFPVRFEKSNERSINGSTKQRPIIHSSLDLNYNWSWMFADALEIRQRKEVECRLFIEGTNVIERNDWSIVNYFTVTEFRKAIGIIKSQLTDNQKDLLFKKLPGLKS